MTTANSIIAGSLGLLGVKAPGQAVDGSEAQGVLERLNTMLDFWAVESMFAYATQRVTGTLLPNTQTMTIGQSGADFIVPSGRPVRLEDGCYFSLTNGIDYQIDNINEPQFNSITFKNLAGIGPEVCYYDAGLPNGTLYFYPLAASSVVVTLIVNTQVAQFADLTTDYNLAPGYKRTIQYSLVEEIAADYEKPVPDQVAKIAAMARRSIKRLNHAVPILNTEATGTRGSILTGYRT